jgi:5-formyltetrahydrofolate cyclo-ligase
MEFRRYLPGTRTHVDRHGLVAPEGHGARIAPRRLDVVFVPLVAIDPSGTRLGMGGGFYDRLFAFRHRRNTWRKPRLVGVAYDLQRVPHITRKPWDVPLDYVITESGLHRTGSDRTTAWSHPS